MLLLSGWFVLAGSLPLIVELDDDPEAPIEGIPKSAIWAMSTAVLFLGLLVAALLWRMKRRGLVLDHRGLTGQIGTIHRVFVPWSEIVDIHVQPLGLFLNGVAIRLANPEVIYAEVPSAFRWYYRLYRPTLGWDLLVPGDMTSLPAASLVKLLWEWRARYVPHATPPPPFAPSSAPPPPSAW